LSARENRSDTCRAVAEEDMVVVGWMDGCDRILITTDDVINACTNFTNVVIRIMRVMRARVVATHLRS
jgi:hypothetical protein